MRKLFTFFAALLCVASVSAEIVKIGDFYYEFSGTTAKVVQHNDYKSLTQAFIPSYLCFGQSTLTDVFNYAYTPQTITANVFTNVNKNTCNLYVPMDYISLYQAKDVWKGFMNIIGVATDLQYEDYNITVTYRKKDGEPLYMEQQLWSVPVAPLVEGFTFLRWEIQAGNLEDGIILQAVYQSNDPTDAPAVYTNPEDPTQKLIRQGSVYILQDDQLYTIQGQKVK